MIASTGMATLEEARAGLAALRSGGNNDIVLLQCTTNYPSRLEDANLMAMQTMRDALDVAIGYSDHTQTDTACIASIALGAVVIEKHFTLDTTLPGPDQSSSADPVQFAELVRRVLEAEIVLGSGTKVPSEAERRNTLGMRRSVVAKTAIAKGTRIDATILTLKRPAPRPSAGGD